MLTFDFKVSVTIIFVYMIFNVFFNHFISDIACRSPEVSNCPEMPAPIPFAKFGKFLLDFTGCFTFQILDKLADGYIGWNGYIDVKDPDKWKEITENIVPELTRKILSRDQYYYDLGGRPMRSVANNADTPKPLEDKFLSHFCYYGLQGHPTGSAEFDKLFQEVRNYALGVLQEEEQKPADIHDSINQVITNYNIHHPNNEIFTDLSATPSPHHST